MPVKVFHCDACGNQVFFESVECVRCGAALGFLPDILDVSALEPVLNGHWQAVAPAARQRLYRSCRNGEQHHLCNWLVRAEDASPYCTACRLNDVIPNLAIRGNRERWRKLEAAKRRMVYTLLRLGLPMTGVADENRPALCFRFLGNPVFGQTALTGHRGGAITVDIAEADDEERERRRVYLHEPFRTLLGHLRHEIAHYYWDQLISWTPRLPRFRELFGNEEWDYDTALFQFYRQGPAPDWQRCHISAYASAHPWEDWAETWAHYLHIIDTVETANSFGITLNPGHLPPADRPAAPIADLDTPLDRVLEQWLPLTCALNSLNRGMGLPDLYPFLLSVPAIEKLQFVHEVVQAERKRPESRNSR